MSEGQVIKEGKVEILKKKMGKKWVETYIRITPGSIHLYEDGMIKASTKWIELEKATIDKAPEGQNKSFCFGISSADRNYMFAATSDADLAGWVEALNKAVGQKPTAPPLSAGEAAAAANPRQPGSESPSQSGLLFRAKKKMSSKMAGSAVVKHQVMNEEIRQLLESLRKVVEKVTDAKTAAEVEKQLIKMVMKAYFQLDKGTITKDEVKNIDTVLRKAFNQVDKMFGYYQVRPVAQLQEGLGKAAQFLQQATEAVIIMLSQFVREENIIKMRNALHILSEPSFLIKVWDCATIEQDLLNLVSAMNKYTMIEL